MGDGAAMFRVAAEAYDQLVGRYSRQLARELIAAAGVRAGDRALDVGCGPGGLSAELAALLGAERVCAVDPSEPFVAAARARLPGMRVEVAPAEALPFADASFDRVLAQLVVNFMDDPAAGGREMRRVVRPGGTVAAAVWDYGGGMTFLRRFWDAAIALDPAAAERDEGRGAHPRTPPELRKLWSGAGLGGVEVGEATVEADYRNYEDLWAPLERGVGPSGAYASSLDPERRAALKDELLRRLGVAAGEPFRLSALAWIVTGTA